MLFAHIADIFWILCNKGNQGWKRNIVYKNANVYNKCIESVWKLSRRSSNEWHFIFEDALNQMYFRQNYTRDHIQIIVYLERNTIFWTCEMDWFKLILMVEPDSYLLKPPKTTQGSLELSLDYTSNFPGRLVHLLLLKI